MGQILGAIVDLGASIVSGILDGLTGFLQGIWDTLKGIGSFILDGLKEIFIPDANGIKNVLDNLMKGFTDATGVKPIDFSVLFGNSSARALDNVIGSINIPLVGTITSVFADLSWIDKGVQAFRPYIRGVFVFLLALYNLNQFLAFIGAGGMSMSGVGGKLCAPGE